MLGVGGISMYQLALAFLSLGYRVYGYDAKVSQYTKTCADHGAIITTRFDKSFLQVDFCVSTGAIKENYKYIKAKIKSGSFYGRIGIGTTAGITALASLTKYSEGIASGVAILDISSASGNYYIYLTARYTSPSGNTAVLGASVQYEELFLANT